MTHSAQLNLSPHSLLLFLSLTQIQPYHGRILTGVWPFFSLNKGCRYTVNFGYSAFNFPLASYCMSMNLVVDPPVESDAASREVWTTTLREETLARFRHCLTEQVRTDHHSVMSYHVSSRQHFLSPSVQVSHVMNVVRDLTYWNGLTFVELI